MWPKQWGPLSIGVEYYECAEKCQDKLNSALREVFRGRLLISLARPNHEHQLNNSTGPHCFGLYLQDKHVNSAFSTDTILSFAYRREYAGDSLFSAVVGEEAAVHQIEYLLTTLPLYAGRRKSVTY